MVWWVCLWASKIYSSGALVRTRVKKKLSAKDAKQERRRANRRRYAGAKKPAPTPSCSIRRSFDPPSRPLRPLRTNVVQEMIFKPIRHRSRLIQRHPFVGAVGLRDVAWAEYECRVAGLREQRGFGPEIHGVADRQVECIGDGRKGLQIMVSACAMSPEGRLGPRKVSLNSAASGSAKDRNVASRSSISMEGSGRKPKRNSAAGAITLALMPPSMRPML